MEMNGWMPSSDIWRWLLGVEGRLVRLEERGARMEQSLIRIESRLAEAGAAKQTANGTRILSRLGQLILWLRVSAVLAIVAALAAGIVSPEAGKAIIAALPHLVP